MCLTRNRPSVVIGFDQGVGKGSGRSVSGIDLGAAIATVTREGLLEKGGGHKMAAGLTVNEDKLEAAMERLSELLDKQGAPEPLPPASPCLRKRSVLPNRLVKGISRSLWTELVSGSKPSPLVRSNQKWDRLCQTIAERRFIWPVDWKWMIGVGSANRNCAWKMRHLSENRMTSRGNLQTALKPVLWTANPTREFRGIRRFWSAVL